MKNIIAGYRTMMGYTQKDMASALGVSRQSYFNKESGATAFSDREKVIFKELVSNIILGITIDEIFFTSYTKNCKEKEGVI